MSETDAQAEKDYAEAVSYFYHRCLHVPDHWAAAPGYLTLKTIKSLKSPFSFEQLADLKWKDFVEQGYVIAGSPATVRDRLVEVLKEMNVGQLFTLLHFGNLSAALTRKNTELYAREVLPFLREQLWNEWEDRWAPHPMKEEDRMPVAAL